MKMLQQLLDDHQTGHSEFQDDHFITIRAGGTPYGQYKQALRELYKRFRGLRELTCDRDIALIEIEKLECSEEIDSFTQRINKVELRRKRMQIEESERVLRDTKREFTRFYQQAVALKAEIGGLTDKKRAKLEQERWEHQITQMAAIEMLSQGRFKDSTIAMLASMPPDSRQDVHGKITSDHGKLIEWLFNESASPLPQLDSTLALGSDDELLKLIAA